jgi:glycosyltransferase involved in cell wall biosynthesis
MKILFIEQFSEIGGGQRNLLDLLPAVRRRGWEAVVAAPGSGPLFEAARAEGASTVAIDTGLYGNGHKSAGDFFRFLRDTLRLRRWIARQGCDLISIGGPRPLAAAALGAQCPVIFQAQHFLAQQYAVRIAGWAIRRGHMTVVANSEHVAVQYRAYAPVRVVYNGVAEIPFASRGGSPKRIGLIGRIAPMKGQTDFLRAAAMVAPRLAGARFVICGEPMFAPPGYAAEVNRLAKGLPVDFLGWRDDVGEVLRGLDLLVAPSSEAEATTRVILEAFSAGVPVVAYAAGGIPEIVEDGRDGFLVREREPRALAGKILEIAGRDLAPVAARARQDWERNYSLERYQDEMTGIMAATAATT